MNFEIVVGVITDNYLHLYVTKTFKVFSTVVQWMIVQTKLHIPSMFHLLDEFFINILGSPEQFSRELEFLRFPYKLIRSFESNSDNPMVDSKR